MDPYQTWLDMADAIGRDNWRHAGELADAPPPPGAPWMAHAGDTAFEERSSDE